MRKYVWTGFGPNSNRVRHGAETPRAEQAVLPVQPLADLDPVFFLVPGPLTFDLIERGFDWRMAPGSGWCCWGPASRVCAAGCRASNRRRTSSGSPKIGRTRCTGASATHSPGRRSITYAVINIAGPGGRHRDRPLVPEADLPGCLFPDRRDWCGCSALSGNCRASRRQPREKATSGGTSMDRSGPFASPSRCSGSCGGCFRGLVPRDIVRAIDLRRDTWGRRLPCLSGAAAAHSSDCAR